MRRRPARGGLLQRPAMSAQAQHGKRHSLQHTERTCPSFGLHRQSRAGRDCSSCHTAAQCHNRQKPRGCPSIAAHQRGIILEGACLLAQATSTSQNPNGTPSASVLTPGRLAKRSSAGPGCAWQTTKRTKSSVPGGQAGHRRAIPRGRRLVIRIECNRTPLREDDARCPLALPRACRRHTCVNTG